MAVYRTLLLLALACGVLSDEPLFEPCNRNDMKCLRTAMETFFEKTSSGLPKYDIKRLDPLIIPEIDLVLDDGLGLVFKFETVNVTGLNNQQILDVQMDPAKMSVVLKTKANLNIVADITIKLTKKDKVFNGVYTASTTALGSSQYGFSLTKKGDEDYFKVGPEINTCEIIGEPNVTINNELQNALDNDSDARGMKPVYESNKVSLRKKALCKIVETAYVTVIHNIRAFVEALPISVFFKDFI